MKLYVICPNTTQRVYLPFVVENRSQIDEFFTITCPYDELTHTYNREDIIAEPTLGSAIGGTILGGLIGALLGGPIGAILGGAGGLFIGSNTEEEERRRVQQFNER